MMAGGERIMDRYYKRMLTYFKKNSTYNAFVHFIGGIGIGFLLTYPIAGTHPVRWGVAFLFVWFMGHVWAATQ